MRRKTQVEGYSLLGMKTIRRYLEEVRGTLPRERWKVEGSKVGNVRFLRKSAECMVVGTGQA